MTDLPLGLTAGRIIEIDGIAHIYERRDPDDRLTIRREKGNVEFRLPDPETGFPEKPTTSQLLDLMAEGRAIIRSDRLDDAVRNRARAMEIDARTAKKRDPKSMARAMLVRAYDAQPSGLSDRALRAWRDEILKNDDDLVEALDGWTPSPQTIRSWIRKRGKPGERRMRDFVDMRGKTPRKRRLQPVVFQIMQRHALASYTTKSNSILAHYALFATELGRVNRGEFTGEDLPRYAQPSEPYAIPSYQTFRLQVRRIECSYTWKAKHGDKAVGSRWLGGGHARMPTKIGALTVQDDTPLPMIFLVDVERGVPIGEPLFTIQMEYVTRCIVGWDLSFDRPSTAVTLRTFHHAGTPKKVPADMAARYSMLAGICVRTDALLLDNATPHHGYGAEDTLADVGTTVLYAGSEMPRDKALGERAILTIIQFFVSALPGATYDIPRAREFGYDPEKHAMLTIEEAQALLARAIAVYHVTRSRALMDRQPALVWNQEVAKHGVNVLHDADEFRRAIGEVEYDVTLTKSGVTVNNLRYSDFKLTRELLDDMLGLIPPSQRRTKNPSVPVKVKVDTENVGHVHVWNRRTGRYVTLPCDNADYAEGIPLWLHRRIREFASDQAMEFNTPAEQMEARADFIGAVMDVTPQLRKRQKRLIGRLMGIAQVRRLLDHDVEVDDEACEGFAAAPQIEDVQGAVMQDMAAGYRTDAETRTPRSGSDAVSSVDDIDADGDDDVRGEGPLPRHRPSRRASPEVRDRRQTHAKVSGNAPAKKGSANRKPRTAGLVWGTKLS